MSIDFSLIAVPPAPPLALADIVERFRNLPSATRADPKIATYYHREIEAIRPPGGHQAGDAAHLELRQIHIAAAEAMAVPSTVDQNVADLDRLLSIPLRSTRMPKWTIRRALRRLTRLLPLVAVIVLAYPQPPARAQTSGVVVTDPEAEANLVTINQISAILRVVQMATQATTGNILTGLGATGGMGSTAFGNGTLSPIQTALDAVKIVLPGTPMPLFLNNNTSPPASYYSQSIAPSMPSNPLSFSQQQNYAAAMYYAPPSSQIGPVDIANRQQIRITATRQAAVDALALSSATSASEQQISRVTAGLSSAMNQSESLRQDVALNTQAILAMCEMALRAERIEASRLKLEASRFMMSDPNMSASITTAGASQ